VLQAKRVSEFVRGDQRAGSALQLILDETHLVYGGSKEIHVGAKNNIPGAIDISANTSCGM